MKDSKKRLLRNIGIILAIIIMIPIICILTYEIFRANGKSKLYSKPVNEIVAPAPMIDVNPEIKEVEVVEEDNSYDWQEGDLRYNGEIYRYNSEILTFLIMGIDKDGKVSKKETTDYMDGGQADALFLLVANPRSKKLSIIAVNRNTIVDVDAYNHDGSFNITYPMQITLQHGYGDGRELSCERQAKVVSKLFMNIPIHGYVSINMGAVPKINDAVGGVPVEVLEDTGYHSSNLKKNIGKTITLNGKDALEYIQCRDEPVFDSASQRLRRQKQYLSSFVGQAKKATKEDISLPITLYNTVADYLVTDITIPKMSYLASELIEYEFDEDQMYSMQGETVMEGEFEAFHPDEKALYEMIINVFYEKIN